MYTTDSSTVVDSITDDSSPVVDIVSTDSNTVVDSVTTDSSTVVDSITDDSSIVLDSSTALDTSTPTTNPQSTVASVGSALWFRHIMLGQVLVLHYIRH